MILEDEVFFNNLTEHEQHADIEDDNEMIECFLNLPSTNEMPNPISLREIKDHQLRDNDLTRLATEVPERFPINLVSNTPLITIKGVDKQYPDDWKIFVPPTLIHDMIKWYHETLGHCGTQKLYDTIRSRFYSPNLSVLCREFKCDKNCQQYKQLGRQFGHLPPRNALVAPWDEVAVDLIGSWKIKVKNRMFVFNALTCIDPVTNLVELIRIRNKTAEHVAQQFENCWLSRYPSPNRCIFDKGGEFTGDDFQAMLYKHTIDPAGTTTKNPQANGICERMHSTVADILRVIMRTTTIKSGEQANQVIDNALATASYALRCSVNHTMNTSPGNLVF